MQTDLIRKIAELMTAQSASYASLESLTVQLAAALTRCEPHEIEALTKAGETALFRMRSRLLEITSALTQFAEIRANQELPTGLDTETREAFESAANSLIENARSYERVSARASTLALSGSSFAAAGIQTCGVPQSTYSAPVLSYSRGAV
ncbi:MAG: hypothetical protein IT173_11645 [Acidobacteria bacterium]|nr:hypothetical protein [Acidobacteriota bacterium]